MATRTALSMYREFLRLSRRLPDKQRAAKATEEARLAFRSNRTVQDEAELQRMLKLGESKLGFLRMTVQRQPHSIRGERIVYDSNGKRIEKTVDHSHGASRHGNHKINEWDIQRHNALQERMHFGGPYWKR